MIYPENIWNKDTRFIEIGATGPHVAMGLAQSGLKKCLLLTHTSETAAQLITNEPALSGFTQVIQTPKFLSHNNADVLILSGKDSHLVWKHRRIRHAKSIVWDPSRFPHNLSALLASIIHFLLWNHKWPRPVVIKRNKRARLMFINVIRRPKNKPKARCYIPHRLGINGFFEQLESQHLQYAILRWFDRLPDLEPDEDIDLLCSDADVEKIRDVLLSGPGTQPVDLYSTSGLKGSNFKNMAYFQPHLAREILHHTVLYRDRYRVPDAEHHFLSMAYHAVYHKAEHSGLATIHRSVHPSKHPGHDFKTLLEDLASKVEIDIEADMESLDEFLRQKGWRPAIDTLHRFATDSKWIRETIKQEKKSYDSGHGLAVFIVRQTGTEMGVEKKVVEELKHVGFDILCTKQLTPEEAEQTGRVTRGGNWDIGLGKERGGPPSFIIVCYDLFPAPVPKDKQKQYPGVTNGRVLRKHKIRVKVTNHPKMNILHSSDNPEEAWHYVEVFVPERMEEIIEKIEALEKWAKTDEKVLKVLSRRARRAKVELIEFNGGKAIKKTFKPDALEFMEREKFAMTELRSCCDRIPPLLDATPGSIIYPCYSKPVELHRKSGRLLRLKHARQAMEALRQIYDAGYAQIDCHPGNLVVDGKNGVMLIDFEFLHKYEQKPATFEECYDIAGCPEGFKEQPHTKSLNNYTKFWKPCTGLSLASMLYDPVWLQHSKRLIYRTSHSPLLLFYILRNLIKNDSQKV
jgi:hypothetical protein